MKIEIIPCLQDNYSYLIIDKKNRIMVEERTKKDIWRNLYQFPLIESNVNLNKHLLNECLNLSKIPISKINDLELVETVNHKLSHQNLKINFWFNNVNKLNDNSVYISELSNLPFPKPLSSFIKTLNKFLK